jgi:drug/metabolite transporter (DMT)-like permease
VTSTTTVWFGTCGSSQRRWHPASPRAWTCLGLLAIPLWAAWPALALQTLQVPAFECLTIAFFAGWIVLGRLEPLPRTRQLVSSPLASSRWVSWVPAIACALGLTGSNALHILATHYIPAAEANLISYLWPIEIIALGAALRLFSLQPRHLLGLALGLAGALSLLGRGGLTLSWTGLSLAALSGLAWALYCIFRLMWQPAATQVLRRGCALSTVLCVLLHLMFEPSVAPSLSALAASAAVGIVPLALGNLLWDQGFRRGDSRLLTVMAYATPLCSALSLVALGLESMTLSLCTGAVLIALAGWLSNANR